MKKYIEVLGRIIEKQAVSAPDRARILLEAAYRWVQFSGCRSRGEDIRSADTYINGVIAGTITDSFRRPKNAVMVNIFFPCELLHAMDLVPMFPEGISVYAANTACQQVFSEAAEDRDVPESFCSYHKTMLGMAQLGVMPAPLMIANTTLACDANQLSFRSLSQLYQVPHMVIDVPHADDEDAVAYVADQLRETAAMLEDLCRRKLDLQTLEESVACSQRTLEAYRTFLQMRGNVSLQTTMSGELCRMITNHVILGRKEGETYMNRLVRAAGCAAPLDPEKKRIFWMHTLPNWQDSMKGILEESGCCELTGTDLAIDALLDMDPKRPYESMARRIVKNSFNGSALRRIESAIRCAKQVRADGVIIFCHWGCKQTMGLSQLAKQMLEAEGLPALVLDGDGCDARNVADGQMVTRVHAFLEQLGG